MVLLSCSSFRLRSRIPHSKEFRAIATQFKCITAYQWINYHLPNFQAIAASKATTMGHIKRQHLTEALVIVPDLQILSTIDKIMSPFIEKFVGNSLESRNLTTLRDTLLPKLMSGEIRVRDAEKMVEDAA